jgi:hypothetical protein
MQEVHEGLSLRCKPVTWYAGLGIGKFLLLSIKRELGMFAPLNCVVIETQQQHYQSSTNSHNFVIF